MLFFIIFVSFFAIGLIFALGLSGIVSPLTVITYLLSNHGNTTAAWINDHIVLVSAIIFAVFLIFGFASVQAKSAIYAYIISSMVLFVLGFISPKEKIALIWGITLLISLALGILFSYLTNKNNDESIFVLIRIEGKTISKANNLVATILGFVPIFIMVSTMVMSCPLAFLDNNDQLITADGLALTPPAIQCIIWACVIGFVVALASLAYGIFCHIKDVDFF